MDCSNGPCFASIARVHETAVQTWVVGGQWEWQISDERQDHRGVETFIAAPSDQVYNESDVRVGADLSWKPSPKVELSATVNPDFGAVEADDVVLNLTASETFFPEKRLFFLEGSEIFNVMPRDDFSALYRIELN